jgi:hypothetical protein
MTDHTDAPQGRRETDAVSTAQQPAHIMPRCPACGAPEQLVWVHGHGQCAHCHMNVMPCCDGEVCDPR